MYLLLMRRTSNQTDGASVGVILFLYPIMQFDAVTNFVTSIHLGRRSFSESDGLPSERGAAVRFLSRCQRYSTLRVLSCLARRLGFSRFQPNVTAESVIVRKDIFAQTD